MDELSLFAIAGNTSSSVQTAAPTDPVSAAPTPPDGETFSAALKAAAPPRHVADGDGRVSAAAESPVEGPAVGEEPENESIDTQLVWAIDNAGFITADRDLLSTNVPAPSTVPRAADSSQTSDDVSNQLPETLPVTEAAALIATPQVEATPVPDPFLTATAPSGTQNVELVNDENPDDQRTSPTTDTYIFGTRVEVPLPQQQTSSTAARDPHVAISLHGPDSSAEVSQQQRQLAAPSTATVLSALTPTSARVAAVPHGTTDSVAVVAHPATQPESTISSEPTALAPRTGRIQTVLTNPSVNNAPLPDHVPAAPNSAHLTVPITANGASPGTADVAAPRILSTPDIVSPAARAVTTESVSSLPTSPAQQAGTVPKPLPETAPNGNVARIPEILRNPTEPAPALITSPPTSEVSSVTRPASLTADLLSSDVTTATSMVDEVLQVNSRKMSVVQTIEGSEFTTAILPSPAADSGYSPRLNVPQPLTSQVLVAMAQNLSVVREQSSGTLTLRLDPPELGQMEVQFRQSEQGVELRLAARVPETLQMLLSRGDEISRALNTMDLDFSKLEIAGDDGFRGGGESTAFEHSSSQQSESEQQNQGPGLEKNSEGEDPGGRTDGARQSSQSRRRSGIRA